MSDPSCSRCDLSGERRSGVGLQAGLGVAVFFGHGLDAGFEFVLAFVPGTDVGVLGSHGFVELGQMVAELQGAV